MGANPWSIEQETMLRERFSKISASKLAAELREQTGREFSRSAVIARARRLGILKTREERSAACSIAQRERRGRLGLPSSIVVANVRRQKAKSERRQVEVIPLGEPPHLGLTLLQTNDTTCKYPRGDEAKTFCGQTSQEGSSYCVFHHQLCYRPPESRNPSTFRRAA